MASKVAKAVYEGMKKDGCTFLGWGDGNVLSYAGDLVKVKNEHPLNRMRAIFAHMERAPELFEKRFRTSMNLRGAEARVRCFKIILPD